LTQNPQHCFHELVIMKIAIPTNDIIHIDPVPGSSEGFVVFTVHSGKITEAEFRQNPEKGQEVDELVRNCLKDCSHVIIPGIPGIKTKSVHEKVMVSFTKETLITNIIWSFMTDLHRNEANTCCCP
jgi:hypothetical protein